MNWILKLAEEFEKTINDIGLKEELEEQEELEDQVAHSEEKMLMELGITPLAVSDKKNSYLSEGLFSRVYRVLFQGRPAVAKVTDSKADIENLVKLSDLKKSMGELGKHLPTVYASFVYTKPKHRKIYVAVVEELMPLNPYARISLFSKTNRKKELLSRFKDPYFVRSFVNGLFPYVPEVIPDQVVRKMKRAVSLLLLKEDFTQNIDGIFIDELIIDINKLIKQILPDNLKNLLETRPVDSQEYYSLVEFISEFKTLLDNAFIRLVDKSAVFPIDPDSYSEVWANSMPESKSLMKLLYKLKELGIYWADLHGNNLMERPRTRDIVIADPGLFQVF